MFMENSVLLNSIQMAEFAARGCLRFDGLIDESLNREFLDLFPVNIGANDKYVNKLIPNCKPGKLLSSSFPVNHPISKVLNNPTVVGALKSLMGTNPIFDHHHVHLTFPNRSRVQTNHQDSTIDLRSKNFDIQIIYFPHEVTAEMGLSLIHI